MFDKTLMWVPLYFPLANLTASFVKSLGCYYYGAAAPRGDSETSSNANRIDCKYRDPIHNTRIHITAFSSQLRELLNDVPSSQR